MYINQYLQLAVQNRASDIHFAAGEPVRLRVDGDLLPIDGNVLGPAQVYELVSELLTAEEKEHFEAHKNIDKSHMIEGLGNFRVNIFMTRRGVSAVLRTIPTSIPSLKQLGLPDVLKKLTEAGQGLILVTGPTGSGKSTTLAAMINHINETCPYHILTAEDPIEFVHPCKNSLVNQREIGNSCPSFADALKYALREDPDVILVGEMRDLETIGLALTASETGHLVFGTLHTRGAAASIDRIIDSFPSNQQAMIRAMLSESLVAVVSQTLLKKIGGGRVAAYEIMVVTPAISNLIREGKTFQIDSAIQTGKKDGMILMDSHIRFLMEQNVISKEEAEDAVENAATLAGARGTSVPRTQENKQSKIVGSVQSPVSQGMSAPVASTAPSAPPLRSAGSAPSAVPPIARTAPPKMSAPPPPGVPRPPAPPVVEKPKSFKPQPLELGEKTQAAFNLRKAQSDELVEMDNTGDPPAGPPSLKKKTG